MMATAIVEVAFPLYVEVNPDAVPAPPNVANPVNYLGEAAAVADAFLVAMGAKGPNTGMRLLVGEPDGDLRGVIARADAPGAPAVVLDPVKRTFHVRGVTSRRLRRMEYRLVELLADALSTGVPRSVLIRQLWPHTTEWSKSRNNLQVLVSQVRQSIAVPGLIPVIGEDCVFRFDLKVAGAGSPE
jgi:hypothetical protein